MTFSIIIPTYNRANFINKTIQSALNQTYLNFEVIIVDDGSTDNTEEVVLSIKDDRIKYFKKENAERGAARNFGARNAMGDYITFLDSDDIMYDHALINAKKCIEKHPENMFFHQTYLINTDNKKIKQKYNPNNPHFLITGNPLSCIGVYIKREAFLLHNFNEDRKLSGSEDWELWLRLYANYGLISCNSLFGELINHGGRSVQNYPEEDLVYRKNKAIEYAFKNEKTKEVFDIHLNKINAFLNSYISLHLALNNQRKRAKTFLFKAFIGYPMFIFSRRFIAIIKHLIF